MPRARRHRRSGAPPNSAAAPLAGMDLVSREEFEAVKAMAAKARDEQELLMLRVAALEARLAERSESRPDAAAPEAAPNR